MRERERVDGVTYEHPAIKNCVRMVKASAVIILEIKLKEILSQLIRDI